jgi:lipid II:glycine glycyltransferase (peptidoglycan interpeptide bridge formation enzyme)
MTARFATKKEITEWNSRILANPDGGNIFQGFELGEIKSHNGWKIRYVIVGSYAITIHERFIPGFGKLWYLPKGPGITNIKDLEPMLADLRKFGFRRSVFLIKVEPEIIKTNTALRSLSALPLIAGRPVQPNFATVILDLAKSADEVMTALPQKSRHALKRALRDGVTVQSGGASKKNLAIMTRLMQVTMADKPGVIREQSYYESFWKLYCDRGLGKLFFAYYDGTPVAGAFVMTYGKKATYKDGGSIRERTVYGASHALQWHIIEWLIEQGITTYDLCGTPPLEDIDNRNHPLYGVGLFKTSFNKEVTEFIGLYDFPIQPQIYAFWKKFGEIATFRFYSRILKRPFY